MGATTGIAWTDHTFNGWWGCSRTSRGCRFCYAADLSKRFDGGTSLWGKHTPRRVMTDHTWNNPIRWNRAAERAGVPAKVFASSMADVFEDHPQLPDLRTRLFELIENTPWLIWQLLTKRPQNIAGMVPWGTDGWPPNVWIGASLESQRFATERIVPLLGLKGAAVRFLSVEPMVGPVDLRTVPYQGDTGYDLDVLSGRYRRRGGRWTDGIGSLLFAFGLAGLATIDWVILGGESGPRPDRMAPEWARTVRDQCAYARIPFFMKQAGSALAAEWGATGKGHDPAEWPEMFPQQSPPTLAPASTGAAR